MMSAKLVVNPIMSICTLFYYFEQFSLEVVANNNLEASSVKLRSFSTIYRHYRHMEHMFGQSNRKQTVSELGKPIRVARIIVSICGHNLSIYNLI